jgi:hypothetical protein
MSKVLNDKLITVSLISFFVVFTNKNSYYIEVAVYDLKVWCLKGILDQVSSLLTSIPEVALTNLYQKIDSPDSSS